MTQQIEHAQSQAKQNNIIRKAAIQSLQPVVKKIQQYISYLMAQTSKLRQKSQILQKKTFQHGVLNKSMEQIREQIQKINLKLIQANKKNQMQSINMKKQVIQITVNVDRINSDLNKKQTKIIDLFNKNVDQGAKLEKTSQNFKQIVEQYALQVTSLETDNKKLSLQIQNLQQRFISNNQLFQLKIKERDSRIQQSQQKLQLYLNERQQMRKMIESIWSKVDKAVDINRYQSDWRIIRMENQTMKKDNKKMIDEALTPQVRKFLPQMMERIAEVRKINTLEQLFNIQKRKTDQFQLKQIQNIQFLRKQLQKSQKRAETIRQQLKSENKTILNQLSSKMQQGKDNANQAIQSLQNQTKQLLDVKQKQIRQDIQKLIPSNKQLIYQIVNQLIPQQEKDFYNHLKKFSQQVLPLIQATKTQIMDRCDQITKFGQSLQQRLQSFNNRIVKIRGDMTVQLDQMKKKLKFCEGQISNFQQNNKSLGKILSIYCQLFLINFSLSFQPVDKQVYVTYGDGIIYEKSDNQNQVNYRKFKINRIQFKKLVLASLIKLTDSIMRADQYQFLNIGQYKPSEFFKSIKQSIILNAVLQSSIKKQRKSSAKNRESSLQNKLPSIEFNSQNKTIDISKQAQENSREMLSQTIASDFSSIRKRQNKSIRGRYTQLK